MKRKLIYIFSCWLSSIILFVACDDMEDKPFTSGIIGDPTETGTAELYVLCEGLFNQNNINPEKPDVPLNKNDAFQKVQKRRVQKKR